MKTWHGETLVVASALLVSAQLAGGRAVDYLASVAVLLSFGHASISERMREREALRPVAEVACHRWLDGYYLAKEVAWVAYFVALRSWPALVGCGVFLAYPAWRRLWRRWHPLPRPALKWELGEANEDAIVIKTKRPG